MTAGPAPEPADVTAALLARVARAAAAHADRTHDRVRALVGGAGRIPSQALDEHQFLVHGFAWIAAYARALDALARWARRLDEAGGLDAIAREIASIGAADYALQIGHGIAMSQDETIRPYHFGLQAEASAFLADAAVAAVIRAGGKPEIRASLIARVREAGPDAAFAADGLDATLAAVREQFRRFSAEHVVEQAKAWHRDDALIPRAVIDRLAAMGVFGLTVPEDYGGSAMGTTAMCVVTEELSRGYIGVGSLGTRAEIASELIRLAGTDEHKAKYLPRIASGEIIPTAVFTEPDTGSDLGAIRTRAVRDGAVYRIHGAKTWITHGARATLMTLLARTDPDETGYAGLTMFLAEKPEGTPDEPFPAPHMSGGEIKVIGYRGMKEYEIAFDGFEIPASAVLGGEEGKGFKQLMRTFESARIQTAARAIGVAQNAFDLGFRYAVERRQFGRPIADFQRISGKLAWMAAELTLVRQLTYQAAGRHETGARSDVEAGMAKLLAARLAWSCADNALQIHGGNGYAEDYPISRVLLDARILNIFEGAAEIQAGVIGRGLLAEGRS